MQTSTTITTAIAICWLLSPTFAHGSLDSPNANEGRASIMVRPDVGWIGPGQTFNIIVVVTPDSDWHVYWKNPGASGAPTEIEIKTPDGFSVGSAIFPRPSIIPTDDGPTFGYYEQAAIFIPITAPKSLDGQTATFEVTTAWLACKKVCVLGESETKLTVSTNPTTEGPLHRDLRLVRWQKLLPKPLSDLKNGNCRLDGSVLHVSGSSSDQARTFIGVERRGVQFKNPKTNIGNGDSFSVIVPLILDFSASKETTLEVEGLLLIGRNLDDPSYVVQINAIPEE